MYYSVCKKRHYKGRSVVPSYNPRNHNILLLRNNIDPYCQIQNLLLFQEGNTQARPEIYCWFHYHPHPDKDLICLFW